MTSKTKPMSTYNLTHPLISRQSALKDRVTQIADSPEGQSAPKGRVPRRADCSKGQTAPKGSVSQRAECSNPEKLKFPTTVKLVTNNNKHYRIERRRAVATLLV